MITSLNRGQACVKGRFISKDVVHTSKRISISQRSGREKNWKDVGWDEALDFAHSKTQGL